MHGACAWLVPSLPDLSHPKLTQATEQIAETGLLKAAVVSINFPTELSSFLARFPAIPINEAFIRSCKSTSIPYQTSMQMADSILKFVDPSAPLAHHWIHAG